MPNQNCFAVRPDSVIHAWDVTWRVLENNTLTQELILGEIGNLGHRKRIRYNAGQQVFLRWEPQDRI